MGQKVSYDIYEKERKELDKMFLVFFVMKLLHPERFKY